MTIEQLLLDFISISPFFILKIFAVILLLLHLALSFCIVRQTKLMVKMVEAQISPLIYMTSIIHLFTSVFVLIWAIMF